MSQNNEISVKKVDPALHADPGVAQPRNAVNSEWRRRSRDHNQSSLAVRARDELRSGSEGRMFLAVVSANRSLVQGYVCDYFIRREEPALAVAEAERRAENFYTDRMIPKLRKELPAWRPGQPRFRRALAQWVSEAFFERQRTIAKPDMNDFNRACQKDLLAKVRKRMSRNRRDCVLLGLMEQFPDEKDGPLAARFSEAGFPLDSNVFRSCKSRAEYRRARHLLNLVQEMIVQHGEVADRETIQEHFEEFDLMRYLPEKFQEKHFGDKLDADASSH